VGADVGMIVGAAVGCRLDLKTKLKDDIVVVAAPLALSMEY
jgi:hypothetical protein